MSAAGSKQERETLWPAGGWLLHQGYSGPNATGTACGGAGEGEWREGVGAMLQHGTAALCNEAWGATGKRDGAGAGVCERCRGRA